MKTIRTLGNIWDHFVRVAYVLTFCVVGESHKPLLRGSGFLAVGNMFDFDVVLFAGSQSVCYMHQ